MSINSLTSYQPLTINGLDTLNIGGDPFDPNNYVSKSTYTDQTINSKLTVPSFNINGATASKIPIFDASKNLISSGVDSVKITYLDNVNSDIQSQLNNKLDLLTSSTQNINSAVNVSGTLASTTSLSAPRIDLTNTWKMTSTTSSPYDLTLNNLQTGNNVIFRDTGKVEASGFMNTGATSLRVAVFDVNKNIASSSINTTELSYLSGASSNLQTQINGKGGLTTPNYWTNLNIFSWETKFYEWLQSYAQVSLGGDAFYITQNVETYNPSIFTAISPATISNSGIEYSLNPNGTSPSSMRLSSYLFTDISKTYVALFRIKCPDPQCYLTVKQNGVNIQLGANSIVYGGAGNIYITPAYAYVLVAFRPNTINTTPTNNPIYFTFTEYSPITWDQFTLVSLDTTVRANTLSVIGNVNSNLNLGNNFVYMNNAPTLNTQATNKQYVDGAIVANKQWIESGSNLYRSSGNVGVGVNPSTDNKLQVAGRALFGYINTSKKGIFIANEDTYGDNPCIQGVSSSFGANDIVINPAGGKVAIGRTTASTALQLWDGVCNIHGGGADWGVVYATQPGTLVIGDISKDYGGNTNGATSANIAGLLMECLDKTEIAVHDSGTRVSSLLYYYNNLITLGRDMGGGWGIANVAIAGNMDVSGILRISRSVVANRKIVLYDGGLDNDHNYFGMGVNASTFRFQIYATSNSYRWYAGASTTTSNELMSLSGTGDLLLNGSLTINFPTGEYTNTFKIKSNAPSIRLDGTGTTGKIWTFINGNTGYGCGQGNLGIFDETAYRMIIRSDNGYVGIGSSGIPEYLFDMRGSGSSVIHYLSNGTASGYVSTYWATDSGGVGVIFKNGSSRTADGGANTMTVRNDGGNLRLQNGGGATTITLSGSGGGSNSNFGNVDINHYYGDIYWNGWLYCRSALGIYWNNYSRGLVSPEQATNSYGTVSTWGTGRNGWSGYSIGSKCSWMSNGAGFGLHNNDHTWCFYNDGGDNRLQMFTAGSGGCTWYKNSKPSMYANFASWAESGGHLFSNTVNFANTMPAVAILPFSNASGGGLISLSPSVSWNWMIYGASYHEFQTYGSTATYVANTGFYSTSDEREKLEIENLKTHRSLERILKSRTVRYKRKVDNDLVPDDEKEHIHIGFLAQDLLDNVNPHCVRSFKKKCLKSKKKCNYTEPFDPTDEKNADKMKTTDKDEEVIVGEDRFAVNYNDYIIHLVGAVQELHKRNEQQQKTIDLLVEHGKERNDVNTRQDEEITSLRSQLDTVKKEFDEYRRLTEERFDKLASLVLGK